MYRKVCVAFLGMVLLGGGPVTAFAQDAQGSAVEQELVAVIEQMVAAQQNFDSAALDQLLAADYVEVSPVGAVDEREKVLSFYAPEATGKAPVAQITVTEPHFRIRPDSALVIVREVVQIKVAENAREMALRASFTLRKENGKWLIASAQYTGIRQ